MARVGRSSDAGPASQAVCAALSLSFPPPLLALPILRPDAGQGKYGVDRRILNVGGILRRALGVEPKSAFSPPPHTPMLGRGPGRSPSAFQGRLSPKTRKGSQTAGARHDGPPTAARGGANRIELDPGAEPGAKPVHSPWIASFRPVARGAPRFPVFLFSAFLHPSSFPSSHIPTFPTPPTHPIFPFPSARSFGAAHGRLASAVLSFSRFPASRARSSLRFAKSGGAGECLNRRAGAAAARPPSAAAPQTAGDPPQTQNRALRFERRSDAPDAPGPESRNARRMRNLPFGVVFS